MTKICDQAPTYEELRQRLNGLEAELLSLQRAEQGFSRAYDTQQVLRQLIDISLKDLPLPEILQLSLDILLNIPWLSFEKSGSIHVVEKEAEVLVMMAQQGLANPLKVTCARLPFGMCLCGRAAASQQIEFANCLDHRHEVVFSGIKEHGHYCTPILHNGKTIGVLNIYTKANHLRVSSEDDFLLAVANTLAGIIIRKQAEQEKAALATQLLHSQKLEAIGTLAGGIAHDFNNLLTGILGYTELAIHSLPEASEVRQDLLAVQELAQKSARLTGQLLAFSRQQTYEMLPLNLNALVANMHAMLQRLVGEEIELQFLPGPALELVVADFGQLEQVLVNLVVNAKDAMPDGGRIVIATANLSIDAEQAAAAPELSVGRFVSLTVSDSGQGMDPTTLQRAFDPFFTTKEVGRGTGLGLSMVYGSIKRHAGTVSLTSDPGRGTSVRILLPAADKEATLSTVSPTAPAPLGSETILLVEDEEAVRVSTTRMLEQLGYRILAAAGPAEALRIAAAGLEPFNLLVTDVVMPTQNGCQLYEELKKLRPALKVLFISGYTGEVMAQKGLDRQAALLVKPFSRGEIARKIREVLDTPAASNP